MLLLNLLCVLCASLFNVSNIKSEVINSDVIYEKQQILPKRAFTNDDYTSLVNNQSTYRYFHSEVTIQYQNSYNKVYYYWVDERDATYNGSYVNADPSYYNNMNYYQFANLNRTYYSTFFYVQWLPAFTGVTQSSSLSLCILRFYSSVTSPIDNIEFSIPTYVNFPSYERYVKFGVGNFINDYDTFDNLPKVMLDDGPIFLLSSYTSVQNNVGASPNNSDYPSEFAPYWFAFLIDTSLLSSVSFNLNFNYLGAFEKEYSAGYSQGYNSGYSDGVSIGYQQGYSDGFDEADNMDDTALTIFTGILEVGMLPVNVFLAIFNFEVFGINIAGIVSALLTVTVVIIILRFLLGGKTKDD